jgi:penicillin-binding protein 1A
VVQRGTAARAGSIDWPLAGKTGTVDDFTDAWFVGFDPHLTAGVWIGYDEKKPLGRGEDGAHTALPVWMDFMKAYIEGRTDRPEFAPPGNIVFLRVDKATGGVADSESADAINEAFISGTQPGAGFPK